MRRINLKDTNNFNQANQSRISVYIQNTIFPQIGPIEHNRSNELAFAYFE